MTCKHIQGARRTPFSQSDTDNIDEISAALSTSVFPCTSLSASIVDTSAVGLLQIINKFQSCANVAAGQHATLLEVLRPSKLDV